MGSASSRMSASPALVDPATKRPSVDSTASAATIQSERTSASEATETETAKLPILSRAINNQSMSETGYVSPPTLPTQPASPTIPKVIDPRKGKEKHMANDKEEGEISEEEGGGELGGYETSRSRPTSSNIERRRSSASARSIDSYRPASLSKPRPQQRSPLPQHQRRPPQGPRPHQPPSKSRSPNELYLQQQLSLPRTYAQQPQIPYRQPHQGQPHQQYRSRPNVENTTSIASPKSVDGLHGRTFTRRSTSPGAPLVLTPPLPQAPHARGNIASGSLKTAPTPPATPPLPQLTLQSSPPEESLALPKSITAEEAEQYMDIIRNLMNEGIKPDVLIKRGATPKYVNMVCREIIKSSRPTASAFTEIREPLIRDTASPDIKPDIGSSTVPSALRSPSPEITEMARQMSSSSASSSETDIKIERMLSPEKSTSTRLVPTSSWVPAPVKPISPMRVETYRPSQPGPSNSAPAFTSRSLPFILPASISSLRPAVPVKAKANEPLRPVSSYTPIVQKNPLRDHISDLSPVVKRPQPESQAPLPPGQPPTPPLPPAPLPNAIAGPGPSAMNALLESKRRAMASMKRGSKAGSATPMAVNGSATPPVILRSMSPALPEETIASTAAVSRVLSPTLPEAPAIQVTLEDEVAALEQEVIGLQNAAPDPMDIDEPEEGEISDMEVEAPPPPATPIVIPKIPSIVPSKTPVQLNKSTKRRNAEEMMDNRSSIQARSLRPSKRRIFGAIRQKPIIINLDESDDSDSDDERSGPTPAEMEVERQRMLKEKEDNINRLREQILRLQAKAARDKRAKMKDAVAKVAMEQATSDVVAGRKDVVMNQDEAEAPEDASPSVIVGQTTSDAQLPLASQKVSNSRGKDNRIEVDAQDQVMTTPQLSSSSTGTHDEAAINPPHFSNYRSVLDRYPDLANTVKTSLSRYNASKGNPKTIAFDEQRLSSIILTRKMQREPNAVICSAEAAGGSCADSTCTDIHFGKDLQRADGKYPFLSVIGVLTIDPDGSLIEYLSQLLPKGKGESADPARLERLVVKAKEVLGLGVSSSQVGGGTSRSKKAKHPTTYDMSVAQRIVTAVCSIIQDDDID